MAVHLELLRRETLDALVEHLAEDHVNVEEFERRVRLVKSESDPDRVRRALDGLPGRGSSGAG